MSSTTWTRDALRSSRLSGTCWRVVEAQHQISTMKITDTLAEQRMLEDLVEETKPAIPAECLRLNFLLSTPFRYSATNPHGSRFRRPFATEGVFYAAEDVATAIAETAFYRTLFYAESPDTPWPTNAGEYSGFSCAFKSNRVARIAKKPFLEAPGLYPFSDYTTAQAFADAAREQGF